MKTMEAFVVAQTHWDREWYKTFQQFRFRLVKLIDALLDLLRENPRFKCFTLDGQTIVLEDYLEVRPEKEAELRRLIQDGRLHIGPWYVLADEFLVSGEALIRNLLRGRRTAERFGPVMAVGYTPDSFGHIAQLPTILRGFGIDSVIFTRGMGTQGDQVPSEFVWLGTGPSVVEGGLSPARVLAHHQVSSYGNFAGIGYVNPHADPGTSGATVDLEGALARTLALVEQIGPLTRAGVLLFNNGSDHLFAQPELPDVIEFINERQNVVRLVQGSHGEYVRRLKERSGEPGRPGGKAALPGYKGELRGGRFHNLLSGVLSSRMYLKQQNEKTETLLERYAEPWAAMAWATGALPDYPEAFIRLAWKYCLQNHPHDSICGCSVDQVHEEMMPRFAQAQQLAELVSDESVAAIAKEVDTRLPQGWENGLPARAVVVFNSLGWKRDGYVEIEFEESDVEVGSAGRWLAFGADGRAVPTQSAVSRVFVPESATPTAKTMAKVEFVATGVPSLGYRTFWLAKVEMTESAESYGAAGADALLRLTTTDAGAPAAENRFLRVAVADDGTFAVTNKVSGTSFGGLGFLEDTADAGDEYDFSPPADPGTRTTRNTPATVRLLDAGPVEAAWEIEREWLLPARLNESRSGRAAAVVPVRVASTVRLRAGLPYVDVVTVVENRAQDHRLRVVFPTGLDAGTVASVDVESAFAVVTRKIGPHAGWGTPEWYQPQAPTDAQKSFVSVSDGEKGLTLLNRGLPEYEAGLVAPDRRPAGAPDAEVSVAVTLLRCVGWLSRGDLVTRRDNAGPSIPTPEAQCLGTHRFEYAVYPHGGDWKAASAARTAREYATPLRALVEAPHLGRFPGALSLVGCSSADGADSQVLLSALKKAETGKRLILRWFNPGERDEKVALTFPFPIARAALANLAEEELEDLPIGESASSSVVGEDVLVDRAAAVEFFIPGRGLVSLAVTLPKEVG